MSLFTWGLGVLSVILLGLIVLFSNKKVIAETKLEQAEALLTKKKERDAILKEIDTKRINTPTADKLRNIKYRD